VEDEKMALSKDRNTNYRDGIEMEFPVKALTKIYAGSMVCLEGASGYAIPAADAAGNQFIGVATELADNSGSAVNGTIMVKVRRRGVFKFAASSIVQAAVGDIMYVVDDQTFDETSPGNNVICGKLVKLESGTEGWVDIELAVPVAVIAGGALTVTDPASLYAGATVVTQLQEVMQGVKTAQYLIQPAMITLETGAPTAVFAGAGADGFTQLTNKEVGLRWNNGANPTKMAARFLIPPDLDPAAKIVVHFLGAIIKAGADEADSPTITGEAYFAALGAAMLADANCGGVSGEFLTTQTNKYQEKTLDIAIADIPAVASVLTLIFNPTDGELPADDFVIAGVWLEVTRQCLTA
jgi:hypothetical protein